MPIGVCVMLLLMLHTEARLDAIDLLPIVTSANRSAARQSSVQVAFCVVLSILMLGSVFPSIPYTDIALRIVGLRSEATTVHLRSPWSARFVELGGSGQPSFMGPDYLRFDGVDVEWHQVGGTVVLRSPRSTPDHRHLVKLPRESIVVE